MRMRVVKKRRGKKKEITGDSERTLVWRAAAGACAHSVRLFVPTFFGLVFDWAAGCRSLSLAREQFHLGLARTRWLCACVTAVRPLPSFLYLPTCGCSLRLCIPGVPPCYTHGNSAFFCFFFSYFGTKRFLRAT